MSKSVISPQANPDRIARVLARRSSTAQARRPRRQSTRAAVRLTLRKEALA
jgi:hypothetical protein